MRKRYVFLVLLLILALQTVAKADNFFCKHIDIDDGLSQPSVTCILSDRQGAIWIGTRFGLNKYRSNSIHSFGISPSDNSGLVGNYIHSLYLDCDSLLWAGTEKGLFRRSLNADCFTMVAGQTLVYSAAEAGGRIFFGSSEGIHMYDREKQEFTRNYALLSDAYIIRLLPLDNGHLLVVDRGLGLFEFSPEEASLKPILIPALEQSIIMDGCFYDGLLYLAIYNKGIYAIDLEKREMSQVYNTRNSGLTFDVVLTLREIGNQLWIGTDGGGLCRMDRGEISAIDDIGGADRSMIISGSFTCLYEDPMGSVWTGSVRNGAFALMTGDIRLFSSPVSENGSVVNGIWKGKDGTVWIGTDGQGVNYYQPGSGELKGYPGSEGLKIHSLTELDEKRLLLSVYSQGLQTFDKESGKRGTFIVENPEINAQECGRGSSPKLYSTEDGEVLIFAIRAFLYDPSSRTFHHFDNVSGALDVSEMSLFGKDSRGYLYSFSKTGLFRIDIKRYKIERILTVTEENAINSAALAADGTIWVGTDDGLKYLSRGEDGLRVFPTKFFNRVTQLKTWRDSHLWIAADNLLFNMDGDGQIVLLDESDGFTANEILASTISNGANDEAIYFGGTRGFVEINSPASSRSAIPLSLELYDVTIGDKRLECDTGGSIKIPWRYESLHVGVNLRGIEPFRKEMYRFEVIGNGSRFVTETFQDRIPLTGLTDGTYRVNASYLKRDGSWSGFKHILNIVVTPPWFRSWWFYSLLVLAVLSIIAFVVFRYNEKSRKTLASTLSRWVTTTVDYSGEEAADSLSPHEKDLLKKVNKYVEEHLSDINLNVAAIANETAMSRASLYTKLKAVTGMGVAQYVEDLRIRKACHLLKETQMSIAEISEQVGFSTPNYFSMRFKQAVGISPLTFRKNSPD